MIVVVVVIAAPLSSKELNPSVSVPLALLLVFATLIVSTEGTANDDDDGGGESRRRRRRGPSPMPLLAFLENIIVVASTPTAPNPSPPPSPPALPTAAISLSKLDVNSDLVSFIVTRGRRAGGRRRRRGRREETTTRWTAKNALYLRACAIKYSSVSAFSRGTKGSKKVPVLRESCPVAHCQSAVVFRGCAIWCAPAVAAFACRSCNAL